MIDAAVSPEQPPTARRKRCFVVMGFGVKTDYATGRKLDLNKSYRLLIKPVVEAQGLECVRADEIRHSGVIDVPMYTELLNADFVVADLSTANVNAFYELGIRHALRPHTTIVISEDKLTYPFDLNHIKITSYTHLGEGIEYEEVERFRKVLGETLQGVLDSQNPDSPIYTYLSQLKPPMLQEQLKEVFEQVHDTKQPAAISPSLRESKTLSLIIEQGEDALTKRDYETAKALFGSALLICRSEQDSIITKNDPYLLHRLILATYKSKQPDPVSALNAAKKILSQMDIENTNDPETVTLAGAIEKKAYELGLGDEHLYNAIMLFLRGYYLLNNRYNGINLAYMLNCRAASTLCTTREEQIADMVYANHSRIRVLNISEKEISEIVKREERMQKEETGNAEMLTQQKEINEQKFWLFLNRAEAYFGLGNFEEYKLALAEAQRLPHEPWMMDSLTDQLARLRVLLQQNGHLLNPAWVEKA